MIIKTDRLILLRLTDDGTDVNDLFRLFSNEEVAKYAIWNRHETLQATKSHIQDLYKRHEGYLTYQELKIVDALTGEFLGICSFRTQEIGTYGISEIIGSLGYYLLPEYWGKGYATEIAKVLIKLLFEEYKAHRVVTTCDPNNINSYKVMERCGMKYEGHLKNDKLKENGTWRDSSHYSISESEAESLKIDYVISM
jgi:ribosomal-protein-alanine N-acetyltransferase